MDVACAAETRVAQGQLSATEPLSLHFLSQKGVDLASQHHFQHQIRAIYVEPVNVYFPFRLLLVTMTHPTLAWPPTY